MSYIGYIPKPIRHNIDLSPRDKLLYCEITASLDDYGICTKNNIYFAKVTGCTKSTISASMTKLRELNYIDVIIEKDKTTQKFKKRYIILKAMSNFQGGGNSEITKTMSDSQGGVSTDNNYISENRNGTAKSDIDDSIIINNNIRYIYSNKKDSVDLNPNMNNEQKKYLKSIVYNFYDEKHKQQPKHIKSDWYKDESLVNGSVNTLYDLIVTDGWDEKEVKNVINWTLKDDFWAVNLISLRTLRNKSTNGFTKFANIQLRYDS